MDLGIQTTDHPWELFQNNNFRPAQNIFKKALLNPICDNICLQRTMFEQNRPFFPTPADFRYEISFSNLSQDWRSFNKGACFHKINFGCFKKKFSPKTLAFLDKMTC